MSAANSSSTSVQNPSSVGGASAAETKGKGLATEQAEDTAMAVDDGDDDDDDDEDADEVSYWPQFLLSHPTLWRASAN